MQGLFQNIALFIFIINTVVVFTLGFAAVRAYNYRQMMRPKLIGILIALAIMFLLPLLFVLAFGGFNQPTTAPR